MENRLPEKLTQLRKHYGYSQGDIAAKLDIPVTEYIKWENGNTIPHSSQLSFLAKLYGTKIDVLIDNTAEVVFRQIQSLDDSVTIPFMNSVMPENSGGAEETKTEIYIPKEEDTAPLEETKIIDTQQFEPTVTNVIVDEPTVESPVTQNRKEEDDKKKKVTAWILGGAAVLIALILFGIWKLNNKPEAFTVPLSGTNRLAVGNSYVLYIDKNGTLQTKGSFAETAQFRDAVQVSAYEKHAAALKSDGTVVSMGGIDTSGWEHVVMIAAGRDHTAALKDDGTVYCAGNEKACSVSSWTGVKSVYAGNGITLGIDGEGKVLASGTDVVNGQTGIKKAALGPSDIVLLKTDGTAAVFSLNGKNVFDVSGWKDIEEITVGADFVCGVSNSGQTYCIGSDETMNYVANRWGDIRYIASNSETVISADRAGGLHGAGDNTYNLFNESENPTPEITAPTISLATVTDITFAETTANVTVRWNPVAEAEYYSVTVEPQISAGLTNTQITSISIPASALVSGTEYKVSVTAYPIDPDQYLPSEPATVKYKYNAKTIQLDSPSNIKARIPEEGVWRISWDAVKNAESYTFILDQEEPVVVQDTAYDVHVAESGLEDDSVHTISIIANPTEPVSAYTSSEPATVELTFRLNRFTVSVSFNDPGNGSVELSLPAGTYVLKDLLSGELLPDGYRLADPDRKVTIKGDTYLDVSVIPEESEPRHDQEETDDPGKEDPEPEGKEGD